MEQHNLHKKTTIEHIDYKDITRLGAYVNPHSRMFNRRRTGFSATATTAGFTADYCFSGLDVAGRCDICTDDLCGNGRSDQSAV